MTPFRAPDTIDCTLRTDLLAAFPYLADLYESDTFAALVDSIDPDWQMVGADLDEAAYRIDLRSRTIRINTKGLNAASLQRSNYFRNQLALNVTSAVRAAWQAERMHETKSMHRPDVWLVLARIVQADIDVMAVRMGFEMLDSGNESLWRHILGETSSDVAQEYARCLEMHIGALDDNRALASAFVSWFDKHDRLKHTDAATLADMDHALPSLVWEGRESISEGTIRCLSVDPISGSSYLGVKAGELAGNQDLSVMHDLITQAHYAQIMDEIGATSVGAITVRDKRLADRLFANWEHA
jgi:hypothetical protein